MCIACVLAQLLCAWENVPIRVPVNTVGVFVTVSQLDQSKLDLEVSIWQVLYLDVLYIVLDPSPCLLGCVPCPASLVAFFLVVYMGLHIYIVLYHAVLSNCPGCVAA